MTTPIEVECSHIEGELMRVRFANSQLISDHPRQWGGTDTGPAPGDMVIMALTAASALAGRRFASERALSVASIGARASMVSVQEGLGDDLRHLPLPFLTYVEKFWRLLEIDGDLNEAERNELVEAMAGNSIARTIREGMAIDEAVVFEDLPPGLAPWRPQSENSLLKGRAALPAGEKRVGASADSWRVSALALDDHTCLVKAGNAMTVMGDSVAALRGPTPGEMLLAGLAACTCVYIARNAQFHRIDPAAVTVRVRAEIPDDPAAPIARVEKTATVAGAFSDEDKAKLVGFAQYCAFGVTLGRGTAIEDSLAFGEAGAPPGGGPALAALDRAAPAPDDPAYCSDGSCCVPVFATSQA